MRTITIDGVEYVQKTECDASIKKLEQQEAPLKTIYNFGITDKAKVLCMGSAVIGQEYSVVRISIEYIERIIKVWKELYMDKKATFKVDIAVAREKPLIIGLRDDDRKQIHGFILAPIIESD